MAGSQPPPYTASKKLQQAAPSPKVQMLNSGPLLSSSKRSAQKDPPKVQPQLFESVRLKLRKSLAAALNMGSEQQDEQCTTEKEPSAGAEGERKEVEGDSLQDTVTATSHDASTPNLEAVSIVAAKKSDEYEKLGSDLRANMMKSMNDDVQQHINHVSLGDEIPSSCMAVADELLHGHGLCWASDFDAAVSVPVRQPNLRRPRNYNIDGGFTESILEPEPKRAKTADESMENKRSRVQKAENLASKIEEQLFKLFGGVNKKYKEKGRSLLFNLKDKNNPELRERVLSGDILPERLCSMTAEELASKELSQWRLAKAEEMAQMVVLPDTEVDVRRLVRKTHKGEIQVEVEETDGISVEVELGGNLLSHVPSKAIDGQTKADEKTGNADKISVERGDKASDGIVPDGDTGTGNNNLSGNLEYLVNEKTDLMQELMVDDLKDSRNLPPIMSLDEFMEALDSEPPFENLSVEIPQEDPSSTDKADTTTELKLPETEDKVPTSELESGCDVLSSQDNSGSKLESPKYGAGSNMSPVEPPERDIVIKSSPDKVDAKKEDTENDLNSESTVQCKTATPDVPLVRDSIWEGEIQLTLSSLTNVVAIFKSGEKPSTKEWPSSVGIKGRVKLSAFQEFLEQLPKSRSRAIMVTELCWKEGSLESGRQHLLQTIDSYIADQRVGLAAPVDGVELYLCPSQGKTVEMLCQHLLKEHTESLTVTGSSVIGVVVWRRPYVSSRTPSHHRHDGSKSQSSSSKQYVVSSNLVPRSSLPLNSSGRLPGFSNQRHEEDVTDDVPPGFGPGVARDDDDLPEFHFFNASKTAANVTPQAHKGRPHVLTSARPVEQMRELVHKYGKRSVEVQPWNDDDDDIPEWNPNQSNHNETRQLPLPVPPPPVQQMHTYHQQPHPPQQQQYHSMQPLQINHQPTMVNNHLPQAYLQPQQCVQPVQQLPLIRQQQHHLAQSAQLGWQPNAWRPASGAPAGAAAPAPNMVLQSHFGVMLNNGGQAYGVGNLGSVARRQQ